MLFFRAVVALVAASFVIAFSLASDVGSCSVSDNNKVDCGKHVIVM
jgi:hypothetical protein